jgi:extradiol dioxygenase family protein
MKLTPFHIAVQVRYIEETKQFYGNLLGLDQGGGYGYFKNSRN